MDNVKVNLSIVLPGSVMKSEQECSKNPKESYEKNVISLRGAKQEKETFVYHTRKCVNAKQSINLSEEAYKDMISKEIIPSWEKPKDWIKMSKNARLISHLDKICKSLGGISFSYKIFEN